MGEDINIDKDYVISLIQQIVNIAHANEHPAKRVINVGPSDVAFADPIGGDSKKNPFEKRCHLYWNSMMVISYDDEGMKIPFVNFCKKFNLTVDAEQRIAIYNHVDNHIEYKEYDDTYISSLSESLFDINELQDFFGDLEKNETPIHNFKPIQNGSTQHSYLLNRNINKYDNIYQADYYITSDWKQPVIVLLNQRSGKVLGMQVRNLKDGNKRMFKIYNYEKIMEFFKPEMLEDVEINKLILYNKLSYLFGILNVDFEKKITIFEGYIDSIFYPNSIGMVGVNSDPKFLEDNNLDIQYFFDNDKAGWKKSDEKIRDGFSVFLWNKMIDDIIKIKKPKDPFELKNRMSKVKDLNKLISLNSKLPLNKWFSKDIFDAKWIPHVKKNTYYKYKKSI